MHTPGPPPEAVLLRLARKAARITVEEAARAAGISKAWLSSIENGYDTRAEDGIRPVRAKDEVVAALADFLRISPERLATEGQRPDAALVLAEMHRQREEARREDKPPEPLDGGEPVDPSDWDQYTEEEKRMIRAFIGTWRATRGGNGEPDEKPESA